MQTYDSLLDRLNTFISQSKFVDILKQSREEYFTLTGEIFEDDEYFEERMTAFNEWFLFDKTINGHLTPILSFIQDNVKHLSEQEYAAFKNLTFNIHSLFELQKTTQEMIIVKDLISRQNYQVTKPEQFIGLEKGDLFEARIFETTPHRYQFSHAFCYHPAKAKKSILQMLKNFRKEGLSEEEFLIRLNAFKNRWQRYHHVLPTQIYKPELLQIPPQEKNRIKMALRLSN